MKPINKSFYDFDRKSRTVDDVKAESASDQNHESGVSGR